MMGVLSERLRPDVECAPWVIEEVRKLEAVLAKLAAQEPVAWVSPSKGHNTVGYHSDKINALPPGAKLYAAPLPAVVQVPKCKCGQPWILNTVHREHSPCWRAADPVDGIAAAPEAPAQGLRQQIEQARQNVAQWPQWMKDGTSVAKLRLPEAPAQGDPMDMPLPCDVKIGHGTHMKGTSLRTLVLRAQKLHEVAFGPAPTKEEAAANLERLRSVVNAPGEGEPTEAEKVCIQAYQVVGSLLSDVGAFETEEAQKILDNLNECRVVHEVLPWPSFSAHPSVPAPWREAVKVAREALRRIDGWLQVRHMGGLMPEERAALAQLDALEGGE